METAENKTGVVRNRRKTRTGKVVSAKGNKTIIVTVDRTMRHPLYLKVLTRSSKLYAHDELNDAREGDVVRVMETRPVSKTKCWRLVEIVERAK
jgi:small subunit ribosomal protein S17